MLFPADWRQTDRFLRPSIVAAWSPAPDTQAATWFAADLSPEQILSSF
jgi:hypothetical protein